MEEKEILHNTYDGITAEDEHWLAQKLYELTGVKFRKVKENKFDIDLVSVDHYPEIWVETEGSTPSTWPSDTIRPPRWKFGVSVPIRRHKLRDKVEEGKLAFWIKINHYRNRCMIADCEIIAKRYEEGNIRKIQNTYKTPGMDENFIMLNWDDVYYGFENVSTLMKRKIYRYKKNKISRVFDMKNGSR